MKERKQAEGEPREDSQFLKSGLRTPFISLPLLESNKCVILNKMKEEMTIMSVKEGNEGRDEASNGQFSFFELGRLRDFLS